MGSQIGGGFMGVRMGRVRRPAVAGRFYPDEASALRGMVRRFIDEGRSGRAVGGDAESRCSSAGSASGDEGGGGSGGGEVKAIIGPHAGYVYSGAVAGSAYRAVREMGPGRLGAVRRVVLIGPAHYVRFGGIATVDADGFAVPTGVLAVDRPAVREALGCPGVRVHDEAHAPEHGLEVHLPFVLETLGDAAIVPLLVGEATGPEVAGVLGCLWGGSETLIVVSSDLSHYLDYATASRADRVTAEAIASRRWQGLMPQQACGRLAIQGLLIQAIARGMTCRTLDLRSSGDSDLAPADRDRVVGYGAFVCCGASEPR